MAPAIIHGGPFGNIAHGCSSVLATRLGISRADYVITEGGFGFVTGSSRGGDLLLTGGATHPRDLPIPGRNLVGVHYAMEFLPQQNARNQGDQIPETRSILATGKDVIVIGGGDTGSDCVGTSNRHGAASVTQFELLPMPPEQENKPLVWPYWPTKLRTSSSHEEGCEREFAIATKEFIAGTGKDKGKVKALKTVHVEWQGGKMVEVPGSEQVIPADLVLLAMGFVSPLQSMLDEFGVQKDARGNARAETEGARAYVVFPLIEGSEESGEVQAASVSELGERIRRELGEVPSAVLHGRLPAVERAAVMAACSSRIWRFASTS